MQDFLPLEELTRFGNGYVPFVDVANPEDERWPGVLRYFQVGCRNNLEFYIHCLESVKRVSTESNTLPADGLISGLLEQIQARVTDGRRLVQ